MQGWNQHFCRRWACKKGKGVLGEMGVEMIFKIAAIGIIVGILHTVVAKSGKEELGYLVALVGLVVVAYMVFDLMSEFFDSIKTMFNI